MHVHFGEDWQGDVCIAGQDSDSDIDSELEGDSSSEDSDIPNLPGLQAAQEKPQLQRAKGKALQTDQLYNESGQFNPVAARADKKKKKKQKRLSLGDDFDFAEAFADEVVLNDNVPASDGEISNC